MPLSWQTALARAACWSISPEIEYDKVDKIRGMEMIFVTTANTDEEAKELLAQLGMPFQA